MNIHIQATTSLKKISDFLIYCIPSNGEVIKYYKFISVVVIELLVRCLNTGPEDRLMLYRKDTKAQRKRSYSAKVIARSQLHHHQRRLSVARSSLS